MSWEDIMRRVLPPIGRVSPHITGLAGKYGAGCKFWKRDAPLSREACRRRFQLLRREDGEA
jgi:hypothetical protein